MEIELPDGTVLDAPDDADPTSVAQNYMRKRALQTTRAAGREAFDSGSAIERFGVGVARPFVELGLGVKDLFTDLSDEDKANLERLQQSHGWAAGTGRVVGELAQFAAPGGVAAKLGAKGVALSRFAPAVADIAMNAGVEALKAPTEDTSRAERAAQGALGTIVGRGIGAGVSRLVKGAPPTPDAATFLQDGVPLTPGMVRGGAALEREMARAREPIVGPAVRARQTEAVEAWNENLLNRASPSGVTAAGHEGFRQATRAFSEAYEKLWSQPIPFAVPALHRSWMGVVNTSQQRLAPEASHQISTELAKIFKSDLLPATNGQLINGKAIEAVDDTLRDLARKAAKAGDGDIARFYSAARNELRAQLPDTVRQTLGALDSKYAEFAVLRRAGGYVGAAKQGGTFTPGQLQNASTALDRSAGKGNTARGAATLQPQAAHAQNVFGDVALGARAPAQEGVGTQLLKLLPRYAQSKMYSPTMSRVRTGQTAFQLDPRTQHVVDALRRTSGRLGAAVEE